MKIENCPEYSGLKIKKMNNEINIENIIEKIIAWFKKIFERRFLLYKSLSLLAAVALISSAGFFAWNHFRGGESEAQAGWYNDSWSRRLKITIDNTKVSADLTNFPVLISTTTTQLATYARTDGKDIIFTDNTGMKLDREIERYTSGTGELVTWVKVPTIYNQADTILYMYYGNPSYSVATSAGAASAWDSNFKMVQHLPNGTTLSANDSTANGLNSTSISAPTAGAGKTDGGGVFDGTDDYISIGDNSAFSVSAFTVSLWVNFSGFSGTDLLAGRNAEYWLGYDWAAAGCTAGKLCFCGYGGSSWGCASGTTGPGAGTWYYVTGVHSGSNTYIYVNGTLEGGPVADTPVSDGANPFDIGSFSGAASSYATNGIIDEVRFSNGIRSAEWIQTEYNTQNSPSTFVAWGSTESGGGPVAYWSFDEGYASTTYDRIGTNNGTLVSNTTWVDGKFGKALSFDGTDDYVNVADNSIFSPSALTLSAWIKMNTLGSQDIIVGKGSEYWIGYNFTDINCTANRFGFGVYASASWTCASGLNQPTAGQWSHLIGVHDGSNIYLYVNGVKESGPIAKSSVTDQTYTFGIGSFSSGPTTYATNAVIDEVKFYNRALTSTEITALYAAGSSPSGQGVSATLGNVTIGNKYGDDGVTDSLVGYYKMDESSWGTVIDSSGLNNSGAATNATSTTDQTKFGRAGGFDGTGDYVQVTDAGSLDITNLTITAWIRARALGGRIVDKITAATLNDGYMLDTNGSKLRFCGASCVSAGTTLSAATWYQAAVTYDGTNATFYVNGVPDGSGAVASVPTNAVNLRLGADSAAANGFNGYLDNIKIYNRALTENEVMREYVSGPGPVGYWRFEEQTGTTAYDLSGNFNTGTLTNGPVWIAGGKVGGALKFDGSSNYFTAADSPTLDITTAVTIEFWFKRTAAGVQTSVGKFNTTGSQMSYLLQVHTDNTIYWCISSTGANNNYFTSTQTITNTNWNHLVGTFNTGTYKVYLNGNEMAGTPPATPSTSIFNSTATFENRYNASNYNSGLLDEVRIYNYARSAAQIAYDYNGGGPVGYWKFDEGYASTTYDGSGYSHNGTLMDNTLWTLNGKFGKALSFDGTNDYVTVDDNDTLDLAGDYAIEFWVKRTAATAGYDGILDKMPSATGWAVLFDSSNLNKLVFWIDNSPKLTGTTQLTQDAWYHVAIVKNGSNGTMYFNSAVEATSNAMAAPTATVRALWFGRYDSSPYSPPMILDEVKIYSYARTPEEIKADYAAGGSASGKGAAVTLGSKRNAQSVWDDGGFGGAAPVGYWRFEEQSGTTAYDLSGNLNTGTIYNALWKATGKVGGGMYFDGSGDYISAGNSDSLDLSSTDFTIDFWVYPASSAAYLGIISKANSSYIGTFRISNNSGNLHVLTAYTSSTYVNGDLVALTLNSWQHIVVRRTGNTVEAYKNGVKSATTLSLASSLWNGTDNVVIGRLAASQDAYYLNGSVDEVKIYNYARSQAQIAYDYNGGKPLAQWKFDEGQGGIAYDASGNGNNGTIYPGTGGTNTSTSTMWSNGTSGKINSALSFDGTDDYVNVGDINYLDGTGAFTVSAWAYPESLPSYGQVWVKSVNETNYINTGLYGASQNLYAAISNGTNEWGYTTSNPISVGNWHYITTVFDGSGATNSDKLKIYVNGVKQTLTFSGTIDSTTPSNSANFIVASSNYWDGLIDDVRIYNYARTAEQVREDYNNGGGAVKF